jgi:hypothetical protein
MDKINVYHALKSHHYIARCPRNFPDQVTHRPEHPQCGPSRKKTSFERFEDLDRNGKERVTAIQDVSYHCEEPAEIHHRGEAQGALLKER